MIREFKLPDVGEGLAEAEIVAWHVEVGDTVEEDQMVAEVETDKAVVEVPAPVDGTVKEIRAEPGEVVKVGEVIITFEVAAEGEAAVEPEADAETETAADAEAPDGERAPTAKGGRVFAAPSARRLARELDVDIETVRGSGPGGRVTEADVRAAAEGTTGPHETPGAVEESGEVPGEQAGDGEVKSAVRRVSEEGVESKLGGERESGAPARGEPAGRERTLATPATRKLARELGVALDDVPASEERDGEAVVTESDVRAYAEAQEAAVEPGAADADAGTAAEAEPAEGVTAPAERVETVPYRGIRRTIGRQMEESAFTAPHVTHHDEVDVTELVETRSRLRQRAEERGSNLTYMPFVVKAVVAGLKEYPFLNSELDEEAEEILLKQQYNIGVATATDAGLMVPVVEAADGKSLLELADEIQALVGKARDRSIAREEMQGGTFTITNFGAVGGEYATPIINYPETAILGLGAIKEKPRVVDGEVVPRKVLTLSLSIDHRVIDGAVAARFVNTVKEYLETPDLLLLE